MSKLYTRSGDDGTTGLFGGGRVLKNHPRVEAYGTVDELNAAIGWCIAGVDGPRRSAVFDRFRAILTTLQSQLFDLGADLATPEHSKQQAKIHRIDESHVAEIESWIDEIDSANPPMKHFVLPGGTELAARLHIARTICRRAERAMVGLHQAEPMNPQTIIYINRISDLLFAMARRANKEAGVADVPWVPAATK